MVNDGLVVSVYSLTSNRQKRGFVVTDVAFGDTINAVMPIIADIEVAKPSTTMSFILGFMCCGCVWIALPGPTIFGETVKSMAKIITLLVPGVVVSIMAINVIDYPSAPSIQESIKLGKKVLIHAYPNCPADKLFSVIRHDLKMLYSFCVNEILLDKCEDAVENAFLIYKEHYASTHLGGAAMPSITIDLSCCTLEWRSGELVDIYATC